LARYNFPEVLSKTFRKVILGLRKNTSRGRFCLRASTSELLDFLKTDLKSVNIVVMPDFFLDRIITADYEPQQFSSMVDGIVQRKGGSIDQVPQVDQKGGNAINSPLPCSR
jgi:hypothetical protein